MNKPLFILRAERDLACEELLEQLSWYCDRDEITGALEHICCCDHRAGSNRYWIESQINERDLRQRGELLQKFANLLAAVKEVYEAERREVAELIACGGKVA